MKRLTLFYLILLVSVTVFGQGRQITGVVLDESSNPLPGANVLVEGTTNGTSTDFDGNFNLTVPNDATAIVVSFIGYKEQRVEITVSSIYSIQMELEANSLNEVVVVGYGTQRKSDITGAITSIEVDETAAQRTATVDQLLQGRAAGVQVIQNGSANGSVSVRIRGSNSLRGNNEPLYVVDGVIISSAGEDAANAGDNNSYTEAQNGLNGINPRDIKSMEILKDASATAIYGSRGANGVVLITTKSGKKGKSTISGYLTTSVSEIDNRIEVLDGETYARYRNESALVDGNNPPYHIENGEVYPLRYNDGVAEIGDTPYKQVNWHDEIYRQGFSTTAGATFSGGGEKGTFFTSVNYNDQGGIVDNSRYQSGTFNININQDLSDRFKVQARLSAFYGDGNFAQDGDRAGGQRSFISNILTYVPLIGQDDEGFDEELGTSNPYSWINDFQDVSTETRYIGSLALTYKFGIEGLSYKLQAGGNLRNKERRRFYGLTTFQGSTANGLLTISDLESKSYQINNLITFNRRLNKNHRINAVAGMTYDVRDQNFSLYEVQDFATTTFGVDQPEFGQIISRPLENNPQKTQLLSFLGRVNYTFKNRYIFTGTFRADGSSKFSEDNRFSYFPAFSFAWRANNEKWLRNVDAISDLKLRAGWGQTGNQGIRPYETLANYGPVLYGNPADGTNVGFIPLNIPNPDLVWETTSQFNAGVDFAFFDSRLTGTIDVYSKKTENLLASEPVPTSTGFQRIQVNRGDISNQGIEFTLGGTIVNKDEFTIDLGGNIAFNRSEITDLGNPPADIYINGQLEQRRFYLGDNISTGSFFKAPANIFMVGEEIGLFYGYETAGTIWQSNDSPADFPANTGPGDIRIIDQNGDGIINQEDRTIIGNPNPDFVFGGYFDLSYKRFTMNILMNGVYGNDIANGNLIRLDTPQGTNNNITPAAYHNAWRPNRSSHSYPLIGYNKENNALAITDRIIEDGSYLRISNVTLGYDVPVEGSIFSRANVFVSGINLYTFTEYSGYNPEITNFLSNGNIIGVDWNGFPNTRTYMLGLNLNF